MLRTAQIGRLLVILVMALGVTTAALAGDRQSVVMQISEGDPVRWHQALANVRALLGEPRREPVRIEIVAYGAGIHMLRFDSEVSSQVGEVAREGVLLRACGSTLKTLKVKPGDLHPSVEIVPSGIAEILKRQQEGWMYIKP